MTVLTRRSFFSFPCSLSMCAHMRRIWSPVISLTLFVYRNEPVAIPVEGKTQGSPGFPHFFPEILRMLGAAPVIDISAVRRVVDDLHVSAELEERVGGHLVCCAVGNVKDYLHPFHRQITGKGVLQKDDVPALNVLYAEGLPHVLRRGQEAVELIVQDEILDGFFLLVGKLKPRAAEYLDPIVFEGVVGGRNHDACIGAHTLCDEGDARRGEHAYQVGVAPHGSDARFQGAFQHISRKCAYPSL